MTNSDDIMKLVPPMAGALRGEIRNLKSLADACNPGTVLQMHKTKAELEFTFKAELIHIGDLIAIDNELRDIGRIFAGKCSCTKK